MCIDNHNYCIIKCNSHGQGYSQSMPSKHKWSKPSKERWLTKNCAHQWFSVSPICFISRHFEWTLHWMDVLVDFEYTPRFWRMINMTIVNTSTWRHINPKAFVVLLVWHTRQAYHITIVCIIPCQRHWTPWLYSFKIS